MWGPSVELLFSTVTDMAAARNNPANLVQQPPADLAVEPVAPNSISWDYITSRHRSPIYLVEPSHGRPERERDQGIADAFRLPRRSGQIGRTGSFTDTNLMFA